MKDNISSRLANAALSDLIAYRRNRRGVVKAVADRLKRRTGKTVDLSTVWSWLHTNPKKRTMPTLGTGLLLMEIGKEVMAEAEKT